MVLRKSVSGSTACGACVGRMLNSSWRRMGKAAQCAMVGGQGSSRATTTTWLAAGAGVCASHSSCTHVLACHSPFWVASQPTSRGSNTAAARHS